MGATESQIEEFIELRDQVNALVVHAKDCSSILDIDISPRLLNVQHFCNAMDSHRSHSTFAQDLKVIKKALDSFEERIDKLLCPPKKIEATPNIPDSGERNTKRFLMNLGACIPRKHREGLMGDIYEDVSEYRANAWTERRLRIHILWQFSWVLISRLKWFLIPLVFVGAKIKQLIM